MSEPVWLTKARAEGRIVEHGVNTAVFIPHPDVIPIGLEHWTEAEFQTAVCDLAHAYGWKVAHFRKVLVHNREKGTSHWETPVGQDGKGWPDLYLARPGCRPIHAELKVERNVPSAEQWDWIHLIRSTGGKAEVWYPSDWRTLYHTLTQYGHAVKEDHSIAHELHRLADDGCKHNPDDPPDAV